MVATLWTETNDYPSPLSLSSLSLSLSLSPLSLSLRLLLSDSEVVEVDHLKWTTYSRLVVLCVYTIINYNRNWIECHWKSENHHFLVFILKINNK